MNPTFKFGIVTFFILTGVAAEAACNSSIPASTPASRFLDNSDGTVTDVRTGLMWMRCSLGQTWTGSTCSGTAAQYAWSEALTQAHSSNFASHGDWRLPNVKELSSIVERQCSSPAINSIIFPATSTWSYWTSSPNVSGNGNAAYAVGFGQGNAIADTKAPADTYWYYHARLVRSVR